MFAMKKILIALLGLFLAVSPLGCVAILAGGAGAAAAYWYAVNHRKCPYCFKQISTHASRCPNCQKEVEPTESPEHRYRKTAFGKVACIYCDELIAKEATACPKCKKEVLPLKPGESTVDAITKKLDCPTCHKKISPQATICPHCQRQI